ncbi:MAG: DUF4956 domain-containing protein [Lachnospiraceae bacterium]|nr:DUF4956 domain-containing protein [Lachnospiraceae bacterium]
MFWDNIMSTLTAAYTAGSMLTLVLNSLAALVLSLLVFLSYRLTYTGTAFSKKFMISLGMMSLVTTIIMNVISNNVALSLGMVGALSIIRFRTAVKDVRDATYIFWCIAIGVACGVSLYAQALVGSVVIFVFLLVCGQVHTEGRYLLVIRGNAESRGRVVNAVTGYFKNTATLRSQTITAERGDLIFEVSARALKKYSASRGSSICESLVKIDGVESVDLVQQTDDISR